MFKKILYFFANSIWFLLCVKYHYYFKRSSLNIEYAQERLLLRILKRNSKTVFGKKYGFSRINNIADFRTRVPLSTYDSYSAYIELIWQGKQNVLTKESVLAMVPSSGSTAPSKYIPFTKSLQREFLNGINPWICDLFLNKKRLLFGSSYWSITPIGENNKINGRIKVGFEKDSEYFGKSGKYLLNILFAVPKEVAQIKDIEAFRYVTLLFLLRDKNLSYISVWNPTFLMLLLKSARDWNQMLINDIKNGTITLPVNLNIELKNKILKKLSRNTKRAEELSFIFGRWKRKGSTLLDGVSLYEEIWPNLVLVSCWADGNASYYMEELKTFFPRVEIQPKGLIATEGVVSFPLIGDTGAALSINSHFLEFIEIEKIEQAKVEYFQNTLLAHQLRVGKLYSVIITSSGGLYRYRLQDVVRVVGFRKQCPLIRFVSKENKISDLFGEKLNEHHVLHVLNEVFKRYSLSPSFYMIAPEKELNGSNYFYTVFLQFTRQNNGLNNLLKSLLEEIEGKLQENYHYRYCRDLGQLSKLRLFVINSDSNTQETYLRTYRSSGQRLGGIKPSILSTRVGWSNVFDGVFI